MLKRNFVGYFSNPTGYVFLCMFVLLTSIAAFWPHEFFVANLANLDQLNSWIPLDHADLHPAITMSIWAEERRQGTDELLLTLPAADFDIVIGKYLAAASIFTVSLLFSQLANYSVLVSLTLGRRHQGRRSRHGALLHDVSRLLADGPGDALDRHGRLVPDEQPDGQLHPRRCSSTSFRWSLYYADVFVPGVGLAQQISRWSSQAQFDDFGRGVVSFSSVACTSCC